MSFKVTPEATLSAAVATAGTITLQYPTGTDRGDFIGGVKNRLGVGATAQSRKFFDSADDFTVSLGASDITVTWKNANTIPSGSKVVLQLDKPGSDGREEEIVYPARVAVVGSPNLVELRLGAPDTSSATYFRAAAAIGGAGALTLLQTTLDVPRNIIITNAGDDTGDTYTVTGTDEYGVTVVETITGANAGVAAGKKAFKTVTGIVASGASAGNVSVGFGDVLGLPIWVPSVSHVLKELENDGNPTGGTFAYGLGVGTVSTATTADVRGTYDPNSACDGSKVFSVLVWVGDPTFKGNTQYDG